MLSLAKIERGLYIFGVNTNTCKYLLYGKLSMGGESWMPFPCECF